MSMELLAVLAWPFIVVLAIAVFPIMLRRRPVLVEPSAETAEADAFSPTARPADDAGGPTENTDLTDLWRHIVARDALISAWSSEPGQNTNKEDLEEAAELFAALLTETGKDSGDTPRPNVLRPAPNVRPEFLKTVLSKGRRNQEEMEARLHEAMANPKFPVMAARARFSAAKHGRLLELIDDIRPERLEEIEAALANLREALRNRTTS